MADAVAAALGDPAAVPAALGEPTGPGLEPIYRSPELTIVIH